MTPRPGTIYWIDHAVVCTNDADRWEQFISRALDAQTLRGDEGVPLNIGYFIACTRSRLGGFKTGQPIPPTRGLGKGLPRYAFFVLAADLDAHRRRLEQLGFPYGDPVRTSGDGAAGISLGFEDPDGNQFEFWAPDVLPEGAMVDCGPERVGHLSHGTFESRNLDRTAAFFERYCALEPLRGNDIAADSLVLPLVCGGRLVFHRVGDLGGRTEGCGLPDAHTALLVRREDYFPNYRRMWDELPEWDFDAKVNYGKPVPNAGTLTPRTVKHGSPAGKRFHALTHRGDDWIDPDSNMFHFYGGTPVGNSMATYDAFSLDYYLAELERDGSLMGATR